jgi:hypothetical protein
MVFIMDYKHYQLMACAVQLGVHQFQSLLQADSQHSFFLKEFGVGLGCRVFVSFCVNLRALGRRLEV